MCAVKTKPRPLGRGAKTHAAFIHCVSRPRSQIEFSCLQVLSTLPRTRPYRDRERTTGIARQRLLRAVSRKPQPRRWAIAAHINPQEMQPLAFRHQLGHIAFLPLPAERLGFDCKIGGEKTQDFLHAAILAGIGKADAMPGMPFQQMRQIPRTWLGCSRYTGSIKHATSPCLESMIVAVDEAEFWRSGVQHNLKCGTCPITFR
jgi:hypothetical protein